MGEAVLVAIISGCISLLGTILTILATTRKTNEEFRIAQAKTDVKIEELTREVREHNNFARRMPVVEEQIKVANHRIADLEEKVNK